MKASLLIAVFCVGPLFYAGAQVQSKVSFSWQVPKTKLSGVYFKSPIAGNSPLFPLQKAPDLNYQAPKLPFFCSLEEKSRSKFGLFLKFRAGNDETYRKMHEARHP